MSGPDWSTVNPGLIQIFTALANPDEGAMPPLNWRGEWKDRPVKATAVSGVLKGVKLYLKITSVSGIGADDRRITMGEAGSEYAGELQEDMYGLRRVTLNLEVTCNEVNDSVWAVSVLERIRSRLSRNRVKDALFDLNIGVVEVGASRDLSRRQDQHTQSRGSMDVILTMVSSDRDPVPTGWISTIAFSSHIQDVDGIELPAPPNVVNQIIP